MKINKRGPDDAQSEMADFMRKTTNLGRQYRCLLTTYEGMLQFMEQALHLPRSDKIEFLDPRHCSDFELGVLAMTGMPTLKPSRSDGDFFYALLNSETSRAEDNETVHEKSS